MSARRRQNSLVDSLLFGRILSSWARYSFSLGVKYFSNVVHILDMSRLSTALSLSYSVAAFPFKYKEILVAWSTGVHPCSFAYVMKRFLNIDSS